MKGVIAIRDFPETFVFQVGALQPQCVLCLPIAPCMTRYVVGRVSCPCMILTLHTVFSVPLMWCSGWCQASRYLHAVCAPAQQRACAC